MIDVVLRSPDLLVSSRHSGGVVIATLKMCENQ